MKRLPSTLIIVSSCAVTVLFLALWFVVQLGFLKESPGPWFLYLFIGVRYVAPNVLVIAGVLFAALARTTHRENRRLYLVTLAFSVAPILVAMLAFFFALLRTLLTG